MNYFVTGQAPRRMGTAHPNIVPYEVVPASDGNFILAVGNDDQFRRACEVLGCAELADDDRFATNAARVIHRATLMPILKQRTAATAKKPLMTALQGAGVPVGPINTVPEVFAEPQVIHRGVRVELDAPATREGHVSSLRSPIMIDGAPALLHFGLARTRRARRPNHQRSRMGW